MNDQGPTICEHCNNPYHGLDHWRTCPQSERNRLLQIEAAHRDARPDLDNEIRGLINTGVPIGTIIDILEVVVTHIQEPVIVDVLEQVTNDYPDATHRRIFAAILRTLRRTGDSAGSLVAVQDCYLDLTEQRDRTRQTQSRAPAPANPPLYERTNFPSRNDASSQLTGDVGEQVRQALQPSNVSSGHTSADSSPNSAPVHLTRSAGAAQPDWTAAEDDILLQVVADLPPNATWGRRVMVYNTRARAGGFPERSEGGMSARFGRLEHTSRRE